MVCLYTFVFVFASANDNKLAPVCVAFGLSALCLGCAFACMCMHALVFACICLCLHAYACVCMHMLAWFNLFVLVNVTLAHVWARAIIFL